jgi:excisionase family DNA binding protein
MEPLLSIPEVAAILGISEHTLRGHVARGKISHRRIGGMIRFTEADLSEFVEGAKVSTKVPGSPISCSAPSRPLKWMRRQGEPDPPHRRSRKAGGQSS